MYVKKSSSKSSGGIGCFSLFAILLTVLFIGLKLTGHIEWSWWWVLTPIWVAAILWIGLLVIVVAILVIAELVD